MKVNIQPVSIQKTPALSATAAIVEIVLVNYQLGGHDAAIYCRLYDAQSSLISEWNLSIGAVVVDAWGTDDNVLVNAVLTQLGVSRA